MKGLVIWAQSICRSTMGLYRALGKALGVPVVVPVWHYQCGEDNTSIRRAVGFSEEEFSDVKTFPVGEDFSRGLEILNASPGWHHLFCEYHRSPNFRRLLIEAASRRESVAIGSEAPCNMENGFKRFEKEIYYRTVLPHKVKRVIQTADFFVNYSGNDDANAKLIGWPSEKIVPFGYFPPPIIGSSFKRRTNNEPFEILSTGLITWYRGCDILIDALRILSAKGVKYHATITQGGPLRDRLQQMAIDKHLSVDFTDFLPLRNVIEMYETCSVYVGAGRHEPWGMRLNDALNCGAPLVVSEGMGGRKIVEDYGCGLTFKNESAVDLAEKLERMAKETGAYLCCANNAVRAAEECSPENKACNLARIMKERWNI